ncbi:glycosyltransferase family 4 protein [uncultured Psychroserpens sp.]|uniref:glycosyltransferase family 4 protein n=1 Tax=uncultured Psychroserpens sp. TaxID=255436 RepID=UPI0026333E63|nr:glycosyltransferase family 4 protein [uncultured Psychroserpens sp.]
MKKILYIGNKLENKSSNLSSIHTLGRLFEGEGFTLYYASSKPNKIIRLLDMIFAFFRRAYSVNVVIIDTYSTHNFYFALIISQLCRLFRVPYIPSLNGGNLPARLKAHPVMCGMIFKNSKCNVSPSRYLKSTFEDYGFNNVIHIPNTLQIENYNLHHKTFDEPRLLWVRSFSKIYNPQLAIKVFDLIKRTFPEAKLCMVGPDSDGTLKDVKQLAKALNLDVKFTGKLTKKEWIDLSKDYNIFINTTNFDNTPVSVIEAMALGLPIVSTNVGGMPFLIDNGTSGILVQPEHVRDMTTAILSLIDNKVKRDHIIAEARLVAEQFDWKNIKKLWITTLSQDNC